MRESFYHFMRNLRDPNNIDDKTQVAYAISNDGQFPKTATDYDEVSRYLETQVDYMPSMDVFDQLWDEYQAKKQSI